eukprot:SAG11_NODE_8978_length_957_cov_0.737762_1_plen_104_part_00
MVPQVVLECDTGTYYCTLHGFGTVGTKMDSVDTAGVKINLVRADATKHIEAFGGGAFLGTLCLLSSSVTRVPEHGKHEAQVLAPHAHVPTPLSNGVSVRRLHT